MLLQNLSKEDFDQRLDMLEAAAENDGVKFFICESNSTQRHLKFRNRVIQWVTENPDIYHIYLLFGEKANPRKATRTAKVIGGYIENVLKREIQMDATFQIKPELMEHIKTVLEI